MGWLREGAADRSSRWDCAPTNGLGRAAIAIARALAAEGADVTLIDGTTRGRGVVEGVPVVGAAPGPVLGWLRRRAAIGHLAGPLAFARALRRAGPFDVVEATNWYGPGLMVRGPLVLRHSTPAATSVEQQGGLRDRVDGWAARWVERRAARRARGQIANTADHGRRMAILYATAPPGAGHAVIGLDPAEGLLAAAREIEGSEPDLPPRLLFVGRATRRKGFDLLMAAIAEAADERRAFAVDMVGVAPEDLAGLAPKVQARVACHRGLDDRGLAGLYARATLVLAPSRYESFGLVYREALLFGTPVAALADDPGAREAFATRHGGLLVGADAYPAAVAGLLSVPSALARLREGAAADRAMLLAAGPRLGVETLAAYREFGLLPHSAALTAGAAPDQSEATVSSSQAAARPAAPSS